MKKLLSLLTISTLTTPVPLNATACCVDSSNTPSIPVFSKLGKEISSFFKFSNTTGIFKDETGQAWWFDSTKIHVST
ncbi:hypothetical protein [Spiroplasma endosymbiont of Nebria brevicollis]|uniref:hypothetical protein n=1 Tax=Spiroplasma endosymbiont of Nebria brevicollis TaxID=3066284 RepID=UPI00313DBF53